MYTVTDLFGDARIYYQPFTRKELLEHSVEDMNLQRNINIMHSSIALKGSDVGFIMIRWIDSHKRSSDEIEKILASGFIEACKNEDIRAGMAPLDLGLSADYMFDGVMPILSIAVSAKRYDLVLLLLKRRANPNICCGSGLTPLGYAVLNYNIQIISLLLLNGASQYAGHASAMDLARKHDYMKIISMFVIHQS